MLKFTLAAVKLSVLALAINLVLTMPAHAYLDPGTISMVLQGIIGAIAAGFVAMKMYWHKFTGLFSGNRAGEDVATSDDAMVSDTAEAKAE